jgi:hypothetical protein
MTRIPVTLAELEQLVDAEAPTWRKRANDRAQLILTARKYDEASSIWSEVKSVFLRLQRYKCSFCERQLATEDYGGGVEWDLEHFRPKGSVKVWPGASKFPYLTDTASPAGYYWLAYHLLNYSASCKKCNEPLKKDYFPVLAARGRASDDPLRLTEIEKPFLPYPVGDFDDDPAEIVTFLGLTAIPTKKTGPRRRRADVTIEFFKLNDRGELQRERAEVIALLDVCLNAIRGNSPSEADRQAAEDGRDALVAEGSRHSACATAFAALWKRDRNAASKIADACRVLLKQIR